METTSFKVCLTFFCISITSLSVSSFTKNERFSFKSNLCKIKTLCTKATLLEGSSPFKQRIGLLERKIRVVKKNSNNETDWLKWSKHAFLNLFMVFNIKKIACFWQEKTFLQHRAGVVQKNYVKLFILILIFTTTTELKWGLKDNYGTSCYGCTKCLKIVLSPLFQCQVILNVKLF